MGRYYSGDIDGKFWFAVQSSSSADRFGVQGFQPNYLEYNFYEEDKPKLEEELKRIEKALGEQLQNMNEFFDKHNSYTHDQLIENGIDVNNLSEYADYKLGRQILDCINELGYCEFEAEL